MKTSGFREIDFSETECKNCGFYAGKRTIMGDIFPSIGKVFRSLDIKEIDCPVCKGVGFIDESVTTELELG